MPDRSPTIENKTCPTCSSDKIDWNKVEVDIGDKNGTVAYIQFEYCYDCGWKGKVEWFD